MFLAINDYNDVAKGILFAIYEIFWKIVYAIGNLIDVITGLFYKLAGIDYLGSGSESLVEEQDLLTKLFNQNIVSNMFIFMMVASVLLMAVFGGIAVIKQNYFSKEEAKSTSGVIKNMVLGAVFLICLAPIAMFAISSISTLTSSMAAIFSDKTNVSLADLLFNSSFIGNPIEAYNKINGTEITSWVDIKGSFLFDLDYGSVDTGVTFNWYVYLLGAGIVLFNLIVIVIKLVKRIFNIIVLYLLAPLYISRMVDDGGVKFKEWKNKILPELMYILGTVLGFMIVLSLVGTISEMELIAVQTVEDPVLGQVSTDNNATITLINNLAKVVLVVAGISVTKDAGDLLGNVFKSSNDESVSLLEGVFNRLGPKGYDTSSGTKQSAPRTRVITKSTTSTRRVINYNETVPMSSGGGSGNINVTNNTKNDYTANVQNVDRKVNNIQNRTNVSISERGSTNAFGVKNGASRPIGEGTNNFKATDALNKQLMGSFRKETDSIRNEWGFMKNSNSEQSKQVVKDFETASRDFDSAIGSGETTRIKSSMNKYVEAYRNEEKVAKEGYRDFAGKSAKLSNDLSSKQQQELRNISNAYRKAQLDYGKTAQKLNEVSKGNMSAADALRVKEKADKQREKLMEASSKANDFYNNQKKGV